VLGAITRVGASTLHPTTRKDIIKTYREKALSWAMHFSLAEHNTILGVPAIVTDTLYLIG
jgi:hypothetical protein